MNMPVLRVNACGRNPKGRFYRERKAKKAPPCYPSCLNLYDGIKCLKISNKGRMVHKGYEVDSIFYSLKKAPWQVLLSLHFKGIEYTADSVNAEKNRQKLLSEMIWTSRKQLGLAQNDLIHIGNSEKQNDRCHIHALVLSKEKALVDSHTLAETLRANAPWEILSFPSASSDREAFKALDDCTDEVAYYCKRNKNDMEVRSEYISPLALSYLKQYADTSFWAE